MRKSEIENERERRKEGEREGEREREWREVGERAVGGELIKI